MQRRQWKKGLVWLTAAMLGLFLAGPARAADDKDVFDLGEVVVKGKGETITAVTTVDEVSAKKMEEENVQNVSEALDTLPGVYISVGQKNEANINVRGFNERYVPVFLDGIPLYIPYDGYVDTGNLDTNSLSKITLTKGVASVLYGPNTMGGVINLVSKVPEKPFEGGLSMEYAQPGTDILTTNLGFRQGSYYFSMNGGYTKSIGYKLSDSFEPTKWEDGNIRENSDLEDKNVSAKIGFIPADGHEYAFGIQHVERTKGLPPTTDPDTFRPRYWRFTDWDKDTYYLLGNSKLTDKLSSQVRLFHDSYFNVLDSYDNDSYNTQNRPYAFHSTYDDYSYGGSLTLRTQYIPKNNLSLAIHYKKDVHGAQGDYGEEWEHYEQSTKSLGVEDDFKLTNKLALVAGVAYDVDSADYANGGALRGDVTAFSPQAGILYTLGRDWDMHLSAGKKTRFPTLHELYSEEFGGVLANPNLEAETATNLEIGVEKSLPMDSHAALAVFYSDISNLITKKAVNPTTDQYQNIDKARHMGFEVNLTTKVIPRNTTQLNYTYLDATNQSDDRTSDYLPEESVHKLYLSDMFNLTDWLALYAKVEYNSERHEQNYSDEWVTLNGFWLVDAKLIYYSPLEGFTIEGGFTNLLDANYELSQFYPREGRTFFFKLSYQY